MTPSFSQLLSDLLYAHLRLIPHPDINRPDQCFKVSTLPTKLVPGIHRQDDLDLTD